MKLRDISKILDAELLSGEEKQLDIEISTVAASDLMSDILARAEIPDMLLTGLSNSQVVRTSSIFGIKVVMLVRGKPVDPNVIELAKEEGILLMMTKVNMFDSCGMLYEIGVRSVKLV